MFKPVAGAPSKATLIESACSISPSVSMTARSLAASPSASVRLAPPSVVATIESNMRTRTGWPSATQAS